MVEDEIVELSDVGQYEPLTVRLRGLIQTYPKNVGILKEFIQNADDAEASRVRIILDRRTYSGPLPVPELSLLQGPALLIHNDKTFRNEDFANIRRIGDSLKLHEETKTGRFGLGFNACYNVTDYPCLLSREQLIVFDPHERIPHGKKGSGFGYQLTRSLWERWPGLLKPFEAAGLAPGQLSFDGTIFRLPLRTAEHRSDICEEPFTEEDCDRLFGQLADMGEELLLFLKRVLFIDVEEISPGGHTRHRCSIKTLEPEAVDAHRHLIRKVMAPPSGEAVQSMDRVSYLHQVQVKVGKTTRTALWRVVGGLYADAKGELRAAAEAMHQHGQKAIPWAGAAARLESGANVSLAARSIPGKIYCGLPLADGDSGLPVHINGYFDVDPARRGLTADKTLLGKDKARYLWNQVLLRHAVAPAYAALMAALTADVAPASASQLYELFPGPESSLPEVLRTLHPHVYALLAGARVIRRVGPFAPWAHLGELHPPPPDWVWRLQEPLRASGMAIPEPPLPPHVLGGFTAAKAPPTYLTPQMLRQRLRKPQDVDTPLELAEDPALRRREWVRELLAFCRSDEPKGRELIGLPLALLADGRLHTFGHSHLFLANEAERALLPQPRWFLEDAFRQETGLTEIREAHLREMTPALVIAGVKAVLPALGMTSPCAWNPVVSEPPNARWLAGFYEYLTSHPAGVQLPALKELAFVPDEQGGVLYRPARPDTPLLPSEEQRSDKRLRHALDAFSIPWVGGGEALMRAICAFTQVQGQDCIRPLRGPELIDALSAYKDSWTERARSYDPGVHDVILGLLSQAETLEALPPPQLRRLRALPIFPLADDQLTSLDVPQVYLPTDTNPPQTTGSMRLLKAGKPWQKLLVKLGVPRLSRDRLIHEVLLPLHAQLSPPEQLQVLTWVRDNLERARAEADKAAPQGGPALQRLVAQASLVRGRDGGLHPAARLYDPTVPLIEDVLGHAALFPDDRATYADFAHQWRGFFASLGMTSAPKPQDLLGYVDHLVQRAVNEGPRTVADGLLRVFDYISECWSELGTTTVQDGRVTQVPLVQALARRRWLPAQDEPTALSRYAAATVPELRLYVPSELFPPTLGHLVASQRPIAAFAKMPSAGFLTALGMATSVPLELVMAHFDHLLERWQRGASKAEGEVLESSLTVIYTHLGRYVSAPAPAEVARLQAHYATRPCLWDKSRLRFWKPRHGFLEQVPFFEPLRVQLRREPAIDAGYAALGRPEVPNPEDYVSFLEDVATSHGETPLPPMLMKQALEVLRRLGLSFEDTSMPESLRQRLWVLVQGARLARATEVFRDDASWYSGRLVAGAVSLVAPDVPSELLRAAGVPRLSQTLEERLSEEPRASTAQEFVSKCEALGETLRSPELTRGLRRLIQAKHERDRKGALSWLSVTRVFPTARLQSALWLGTRLVGTSEADFYFRSADRTIFLSEQEAELTTSFLAKAINQELDDDQRLGDLLEFKMILECSPEKIDSLLTRLKVPQFDDREAVESFGEPPPLSDTALEVPPEYTEQMTEQGTEEDTEEPWVNEEPSSDIEEEPPSAPPGPRVRNVRPWRAPFAPGPASQGANLGPLQVAPLQVATEGATFISTEYLRPQVGGASAPTEVRPPTRPGHGHSLRSDFARQDGAPRNRIVTYLEPKVPGGDGPGDGGAAPDLSELRRAALERVLAYEREAQRQPRLVRDDAFGCTVESQDGNETRTIEVKGINGPWTEAGIGLSQGQFTRAWTLREDFWLYVVEHARDEAGARVHPIHDPVSQVGQFRLDSGWRGLAVTAPSTSVPTRPEAGGRILLEDGSEWRIASVEGEDRVLRLRLTQPEGSPKTVLYRSDKMKLLPKES